MTDPRDLASLSQADGGTRTPDPIITSDPALSPQGTTRPENTGSSCRGLTPGDTAEQAERPRNAPAQRTAGDELRGILRASSAFDRGSRAYKLIDMLEAERAELEVLRDLRARVIGFGGDDFTIAPWIDAHRFHKDEPYIGCPFCHDQFVPRADLDDARTKAAIAERKVSTFLAQLDDGDGAEDELLVEARELLAGLQTRGQA